MEENFSIFVFAEMINCERKSIYRWLSEGIPIVKAESICDYLGIHPTSVWGEQYYFAVYLDEERTKEINRVKSRRNRKKRNEQRKPISVAS